MGSEEPVFDKGNVMSQLLPKGILEGEEMRAASAILRRLLEDSDSFPEFLENMKTGERWATDKTDEEALKFLRGRVELLVAKRARIESRKKSRDAELKDYDPDDLYGLLSKSQIDLEEARSMVEKAVIALRKSKHGDVPITLEDQLQFLLRIFDDLNVLYLSNMALVSQFKKRDWSEASSEEQP
jgi:hypothetical protein